MCTASRVIGSNGPKTGDTGCKCVGYNCGCCVHLDIPSIRLNDTGESQNLGIISQTDLLLARHDVEDVLEIKKEILN